MSTETVLIVDDHPANLALLEYLLTAHGYQTRTATDATHALALIEQAIPRLILMDLQMPGMDGLALTRRLKADQVTAGIRIIAVTADAMSGDEQRALDAGCDGYVAKPINTQTFPATVQRFMA